MSPRLIGAEVEEPQLHVAPRQRDICFQPPPLGRVGNGLGEGGERAFVVALAAAVVGARTFCLKVVILGANRDERGFAADPAFEAGGGDILGLFRRAKAAGFEKVIGAHRDIDKRKRACSLANEAGFGRAGLNADKFRRLRRDGVGHLELRPGVRFQRGRKGRDDTCRGAVHVVDWQELRFEDGAILGYLYILGARHGPEVHCFQVSVGYSVLEGGIDRDGHGAGGHIKAVIAL